MFVLLEFCVYNDDFCQKYFRVDEIHGGGGRDDDEDDDDGDGVADAMLMLML